MASVETPSGTWDLSSDIFSEGVCDEWADFSPAVTGMASSIAVNQLWRLTGRRFGIASLTLIPCSQTEFARLSTWRANGAVATYNLPASTLAPYIGTDGNWHNAPYCSPCLTGTFDRITLPTTPVQAVTDITIDGVSQDLTDYRVYDHRTLISLVTNFPSTQNPADPWTITYTWGIPVPVDGQIAAAILACEIGKSMLNLKCRLPRKLQTLSRQGVTMQIVESDYLERGLTGLQEVDEFIMSVNPAGIRSRSRVYSPDIPASKGHQQTWSG